MREFSPNLDVLPDPQRRLWAELGATPEPFTLYGGTALALRFGHRISVDFDFFSPQRFDPEALSKSIPYLVGSECVHMAPNTLTCRVDRGGPILVSFFGGLTFQQAAPREKARGASLYVASTLDCAGSKMSVIQKRAEVKDYLDIDVLLANGIDLSTALRAARTMYGEGYNPLISLKALSFFGDVPELPTDVRERLLAAVKAVDVGGAT